jgi:SAM-dependent methyltransferase
MGSSQAGGEVFMNDPVPGLSSDFFDSAYRGTPPWDIGKPQPDLIALLDEFPPTSPVLDLGCGTGALSFALAERGCAVLGVDLAEAAIAQAHAKAVTAAPEVRQLVEFRVGDALHPSQFGGPFGAVVDSGFYHVFGPAQRDRLMLDLTMALADGGRYYLLGFAIDSPFPNAPRAVSESELQARFAREHGWRIVALRPARFVTRSPRGDIPAVAACFERLPLG